jgi:hypothetical protein
MFQNYTYRSGRWYIQDKKIRQIKAYFNGIH